MTQILFFYMNLDIEEVANLIFSTLATENNMEKRYSSNVLGGVYYASKVLGIQIKLEANSYDYDDVYNYMIGVKKDVLSEIKVQDSIISDFTTILIRLLVINLKIKIALEIDDNKIQIFEYAKLDSDI